MANTEGDFAGGDSSEWPSRQSDTTKLFAATLERKRAEQDAILLSNRLTLLRAEAEKANKKIQDAQRKAMSIIEQRKQVVAKKEERARRAEEERQKVDEMRSVIAQVRGVERSRIHDKYKTIAEKKRELVANARVEKIEIEQKIQEFNEIEARKARNHKIEVQLSLQTANARRIRLEEEKAAAIQMQISEKISREDESRRAMEKEIEKMEKEELELIQKLQHTQKREQAVMDELRMVIERNDVSELPEKSLLNRVVRTAPIATSSSPSSSRRAAAKQQEAKKVSNQNRFEKSKKSSSSSSPSDATTTAKTSVEPVLVSETPQVTVMSYVTTDGVVVRINPFKDSATKTSTQESEVKPSLIPLQYVPASLSTETVASPQHDLLQLAQTINFLPPHLSTQPQENGTA